jgi:hypothetical protein
VVWQGWTGLGRVLRMEEAKSLLKLSEGSECQSRSLFVARCRCNSDVIDELRLRSELHNRPPRLDDAVTSERTDLARSQASTHGKCRCGQSSDNIVAHFWTTNHLNRCGFPAPRTKRYCLDECAAESWLPIVHQNQPTHAGLKEGRTQS